MCKWCSKRWLYSNECDDSNGHTLEKVPVTKYHYLISLFRHNPQKQDINKQMKMKDHLDHCTEQFSTKWMRVSFFSNFVAFYQTKKRKLRDRSGGQNAPYSIMVCSGAFSLFLS